MCLGCQQLEKPEPAREEGEATGTVCARGNAVFCVYMCDYVFMYGMCAFTWVPAVNAGSALLPAGPGNLQLLQPHHCWAFGLVNS